MKIRNAKRILSLLALAAAMLLTVSCAIDPKKHPTVFFAEATDVINGVGEVTMRLDPVSPSVTMIRVSIESVPGIEFVYQEIVELKAFTSSVTFEITLPDAPPPGTYPAKMKIVKVIGDCLIGFPSEISFNAIQQ